jgi:hypothetical protein
MKPTNKIKLTAEQQKIQRYNEHLKSAGFLRAEKVSLAPAPEPEMKEMITSVLQNIFDISIYYDSTDLVSFDDKMSAEETYEKLKLPLSSNASIEAVESYNQKLKEQIEEYYLISDLSKFAQEILLVLTITAPIDVEDYAINDPKLVVNLVDFKRKDLTDALDLIPSFKKRLGVEPEQGESIAKSDARMYQKMAELYSESKYYLKARVKRDKELEDLYARIKRDEELRIQPKIEPNQPEPMDTLKAGLKELTLNEIAGLIPSSKEDKNRPLRFTGNQCDTLRKYGDLKLYKMIEGLTREKSGSSLMSFSTVFSSGEDPVHRTKGEYLEKVLEFLNKPTLKSVGELNEARQKYDNAKYAANPVSSAYRQFKETLGIDEERVEVISLLVDELTERFKKDPGELAENVAKIKPLEGDKESKNSSPQNNT